MELTDDDGNTKIFFLLNRNFTGTEIAKSPLLPLSQLSNPHMLDRLIEPVPSNDH